MICKLWLVFLCIFVAPLRGALPAIPVSDETLSYKEWIEASKNPYQGYDVYIMEKCKLLLPKGKGLTEANYEQEIEKLMECVPGHRKRWLYKDKEYQKLSHAKAVVASALGIKYGCPLCTKRFSRLDGVLRHVKRSGDHYGKRVHFCARCNKGFMRSDQLKEHRRRCGRGVGDRGGAAGVDAFDDAHYAEGSECKKSRIEPTDYVDKTGEGIDYGLGSFFKLLGYLD